MSTGGTRANQAGLTLERMAVGLLVGRGYTVQSQVIVGASVFATELRADLYISELPLIVECKWQDSRGSADEKLCFLVENIRSGCYPCGVIVLAGGGGLRPGAIAWLKRQVDGRRLVEVYGLEEFVSWVNRH